MKCTSGKTPFDTEEIALEALVQNHIRFKHRKGAGPQNIYQCEDCTNWHFTSRLPTNQFLLTLEVQKRISEDSRAQDWEHRLR